MKPLCDKMIKKGAERFYAARHVEEFVQSFIKKCFDLDWDPSAIMIGKMAGKGLVGDAFVATSEGGSR